MSHPLQPIRDYFLDCFRQSITKARSELDQVVSELLLEIPGLEHPEYCYRLYRADIIGKRDGKPQISEVAVGGREVLDWKSAVPIGVSLDAPMVWYGIEFEVFGAPPDERALIDWTTRWMDISDSRLDNSAEFQQVVHSVTPPQITDSSFSISINFGSAPTARLTSCCSFWCETPDECPWVHFFFRVAQYEFDRDVQFLYAVPQEQQADATVLSFFRILNQLLEPYA